MPHGHSGGCCRGVGMGDENTIGRLEHNYVTRRHCSAQAIMEGGRDQVPMQCYIANPQRLQKLKGRTKAQSCFSKTHKIKSPEGCQGAKKSDWGGCRVLVLKNSMRTYLRHGSVADLASDNHY